MSLNPPAKPLRRHAQIDRMELMAIANAEASSKLSWIQGSLLAMEFLLYLLSYYVLFIYKVLPEYPNASAMQFWEWNQQVAVFKDYVIFFICYIGLFFLILYQKQYYKIDKEYNLSDELGRIIGTAFTCFLFSMGIAFLLKTTLSYSRVMLVTYLLLIIIEASLFRQLRKWILIRLKRQGVIQQNILVIGAGRVGRQLLQQINKAQMGANFVGFLDDKERGENIIGEVKNLESILIRNKIDILYITIPSAREKINALLSRVYKYQIDIRIIPEHFDHISSIYEYRHDFQFPCLQVVKSPLRGLNLLIKRAMDIGLSMIGMLVISPLLILVAMAIKLTSKGPVLYRQKRIGKSSLPFMMYKFRTMVVNADDLKKQLLKENEASGPVFKIKNDPRVTRVGAFLRKYSIDELPQLFNVLRGEMSLIGPRPPLPEEVERYTDQHWRRMDVRPGMTGLWQVSGRSDITFDEWVDLDIQYIERWSLGLELKILVKTVPVVLKGDGAY